MYLKTIVFIVFYTVNIIHFSASNGAGSLSFDRLESQIQKIKPSSETGRTEECKCVKFSNCTPDEHDASIDIRIITKPQKCPSGKVYCCSDPWISNPLFLCGKTAPRDIEGIHVYPDQAKFGEFPWQALILTNDNSFVSNGALIDNTHVISTAHFLDGFAKNASSLKVRLGDWDTRDNVEPLPHVEIPVASIVVHPEYSPRNMHNDVAVIAMSETVSAAVVGPHVSPVCLPPGAQDAASARRWTGCRVSGWGTESFERPRYPAVLKKVNVPLWDRGRCVTRLRATRLGDKFQLHEGFVCAGGEQHEDACQGDGGSPLVCDDGSVSYLIGLVSWGVGCGTATVPGVYVDVNVYVAWIEEQIRPEED